MRHPAGAAGPGAERRRARQRRRPDPGGQRAGARVGGQHGGRGERRRGDVRSQRGQRDEREPRAAEPVGQQRRRGGGRTDHRGPGDRGSTCRPSHEAHAAINGPAVPGGSTGSSATCRAPRHPTTPTVRRAPGGDQDIPPTGRGRLSGRPVAWVRIGGSETPDRMERDRTDGTAWRPAQAARRARRAGAPHPLRRSGRGHRRALGARCSRLPARAADHRGAGPPGRVDQPRARRA